MSRNARIGAVAGLVNDNVRGGDGSNDYVDSSDGDGGDGFAGGPGSGDVCDIDGFDHGLPNLLDAGCESIQ